MEGRHPKTEGDSGGVSEDARRDACPALEVVVKRRCTEGYLLAFEAATDWLPFREPFFKVSLKRGASFSAYRFFCIHRISVAQI